MIRAIRNFFSRHFEAIKMGVLVGLLVSNIFLIIKQADTLNQVLSVNKTIQRQIKEDNEHQVESRKEDEQRNNLIIEYLRCIALIPYGQRTPETVDKCLSEQTVGTINKKQPINQTILPPAIVSGVSPFTAQTNQPTTSSPPPKEITPPQPQPAQGLVQGTLNNVNKTVNGLLNGLLR